LARNALKQDRGPLFRAVFNSKGSGEMIRLLVSRGTDKYSQNKHGVSPLSLAITIANFNVVQFLE
jgi:ankyrin repeat protein